MADRIVNLDNSPRPAVTLQVAGKSYTIRRIVTGVHQLWAAYVKETTEMLEAIGAYQKAEAAAGAEPDEETRKRLAKELEELSASGDAFYQSKLQRLLRILELLLTKNGYAFDREWWIENAGEADYKEFIIEALSRESAGSKKNGDGGGS